MQTFNSREQRCATDRCLEHSHLQNIEFKNIAICITWTSRTWLFAKHRLLEHGHLQNPGFYENLDLQNPGFWENK